MSQNEKEEVLKKLIKINILEAEEKSKKLNDKFQSFMED